MVTREEAMEILNKNLKNKNLRKHCLAVEAVMRSLAGHFNEDEDMWGIAGLLHDIDYEETKDDPERHSLVGGDMLDEMGFPEALVDAVRAHNHVHGIERESLMDKALYAVDPLTGLIVAAALISPEKKLAAIDEQFILNRFEEKSFARGANREQIKSCSDLGLDLEEFVSIGLRAMQEISDDIGL